MKNQALVVKLLNTNFYLNNTISVSTSQETHYVPATKPSRLMLITEVIAVYCGNHTEYTNTRSGQNAEYVKAGGTYTNHHASKWLIREFGTWGRSRELTVPKQNSNIQYCLVLDMVLSSYWHSDYSSADTVTWLQVEDRGFDSWQRQEIFLFPTTSRPALGHTQRPIQ
jgi:hypothetical protein